jgi:hypothetical protein
MPPARSGAQTLCYSLLCEFYWGCNGELLQTRVFIADLITPQSICFYHGIHLHGERSIPALPGREFSAFMELEELLHYSFIQHSISLLSKLHLGRIIALFKSLHF